jgi:hypothetical protein
VSSWRHLSWSLIRQRKPVDRLSYVTPAATPAAGADWSTQVPPGRAWRILSICAQFVTSSTAATRSPELRYSQGANTFCSLGAAAGTVASQTAIYTWAALGTSTSALVTRVTVTEGVPNIWLLQGTTIGTTTVNLQAGDQWSAIWLYVDELIPQADTLESILARDAELAGEQSTLVITPIGA